tara:strand:- start:1818 stop:2885 length:1068 start_codon:yes stop_codon:yes gene_type:complete
MATYTRFDEFDQVTSIDRVFSSAWSNNLNDLTSNHFSSSTQYVTTSPTASGAFHMEIYSTDPDANPTTAEVQYSIAYGSLTGKGGMDFNDDSGADGFSSTKAIYSQYRSIVFGGDETQNFTFDGHTPDDIYVININRARYKNALRMGNLQIHLSGSGLIGNIDTLHLTDDSVTTSGSANAIRAGVGREFNLVSGSNGIRKGSSNTFVTNSGSYGFVYPDAGLIILNADALDATGSSGGIGLGTTSTADNADRNPVKLQNRLQSGSSFELDAQEDISSKFYFCRVFNRQFNHSTNDSFTKADGTLRFDSMIDNPQVYITTVGLYNDNQDLLAVAKLSQPLPKNFTKEALIKVKLDY